MSPSRVPLPRWIKALAWLAAWATVVAIAPFVPLGVAIALAVALFAGQILVGAGKSACHLPREPDRGARTGTGPH
jgi:hypothetical protein